MYSFHQICPREPNIHKILKKHYKEVISSDKKAVEILPQGAICVAYKRNTNSKALLAHLKDDCVPVLRVVLSVKPSDVIVVKAF